MKLSIRSLTLDYVQTRQPERIDRPTLAALRQYVAAKLGPQRRVSERYLVEILLETDIPIDEALGGIAVDLRGRIRTRDPASAMTVLAALSEEYESADAQRRQELRTAVIRAKERLQRRLARSKPSVEQVGPFEELRVALLTWLENPGLFSAWHRARRRAS